MSRKPTLSINTSAPTHIDEFLVATNKTEAKSALTGLDPTLQKECLCAAIQKKKTAHIEWALNFGINPNGMCSQGNPMILATTQATKDSDFTILQLLLENEGKLFTGSKDLGSLLINKLEQFQDESQESLPADIQQALIKARELKDATSSLSDDIQNGGNNTTGKPPPLDSPGKSR